MGVMKEALGKLPDGSEVWAYHLKNTHGVEAVILNYGGVIRNLFVPDRDGKPVDVALGYDGYEGYTGASCFLGAAIGPAANRVAKAQYVIDGVTYHLPVNENDNNLHTDDKLGFHRRVWAVTEEAENRITLRTEDADGAIGFPGNRVFTITYTVTEDNALELRYHGTSDRRTYMNITNHSYFHLAGEAAGYIGDHVAQFTASKYTPVRADSVPTGEIADVSGTALDFTTAKPMGRDIEADEEQLHLVSGYDHNFCIDGADGTLRTFAVVSHPATGIVMTCATDLPAFQFYSGNFLKTEGTKGGRSYKRREGFCLETQVPPNSINEPAFPDCIYGPEKDYDSVTQYRFSVQ